MISVIKFILFFFAITTFGFVSLKQITKIKSLILLFPLSISFGIAAYLFICHIFSFLIGSKSASVVGLIVLLLFSIIICLFNRRELLHSLRVAPEGRGPEQGACDEALEGNLKATGPAVNGTLKNLALLILISILISILTFLAVYRFGTFDREFHYQVALTLFHNNAYPPRDYYRPEYIFLYHYGGDYLAGAIQHICNFDIGSSFELMSAILSATTFLSFFALAWLLSKSFNISLLASFCTYFGGGLLWLDAIYRYFFNNLPEVAKDWDFLQTFFNIGIHGSIINAPSVLTFLPTSGLGNPLLILSLILFWKLIEENNFTGKIFYIVFLNVSLFSLNLSAEWLYFIFWLGVLPFSFYLLFKKQKYIFVSVLILFLTSIILNKTLGNALFLQDEIQRLGRSNIFDAGIKQKLFYIMSWGKLSNILMEYREVFCFSWDFISEFGLSLFLFPVAVIYLIKSRSKLGLLLFLCAITTIPIPLIIEFRLNPVDFNRLFAFGNTMIILLITIGIATLWKTFLNNKTLLFTYILIFCLSPISELFSAVLFSPNIYMDKALSREVSEAIKNIRSFNDLQIVFSQLNEHVLDYKNKPTRDYKEEIEFLRKNSKSGDVAISSLLDIPCYGGVYAYIPGKRWVYRDLLYSSFDSIFQTTLTTLDPYLLDELNIKWILISNTSKAALPKETQDFLNNSSIFKPVYKKYKRIENTEKWFEIYHVKNVKKLLKDRSRKIAWFLVNRNGGPIELVAFQSSKITLFPNEKGALLYLKDLYSIRPELKKVFVTAQTALIESLENQIKDSGLMIGLDKRF